MDKPNIQDVSDLLTPTESARLLDMELSHFNYHIKNPSAPEPVLVGAFKHRFYRQSDIQAWRPNRQPQKGR